MPDPNDTPLHEDNFNKIILSKLEQILVQNEQIIEENKGLKILNHKLIKMNSALQKHIEKSENNINNLHEKIDQLLNTGKQITKKVDPIQKEIQSYAEKVTASQSLGPASQSEMITAMNKNFEVISNMNTSLKEVKVNIESKIVKENESLEKKRKECNVCIFNLPESKLTNEEENYKQDILKLKSTFNGKIIIEKEDIKSIYRKGINKNKPRSRPLIIKFTSIEKRNEVLDLEDLVHEDNNLITKIYIHPDKTTKEIEQHRELVKVLNERREKGEENIGIRNGKIVSLVPFRPDPQSLWG